LQNRNNWGLIQDASTAKTAEDIRVSPDEETSPGERVEG
jgi:hypothetical protein